MFDNTWEKIHQETEWGKYPQEEVIRFVARNFYSKRRDQIKMLDMGCGAGAIAWYLAREGFDTYGLDGSPTAIEKAKTRFAEENLNGNFVVMDAAHTAYNHSFFDCVIDSAMICANKTEDIRLILNEAFRIIKNGGKLFSTGLFKVGMLGYGTGEELEKNTYSDIQVGNLAHRGTVHFFEKDEIETLWSAAGFKNIKIDYLYRTDRGGESIVEYYMVESEK